MGVPGLFRTLANDIPITSVKNRTFPYILFDFNCILYEALRCMPEELANHPTDFHVITQMVSYVSQMIRAMGPTRTVYLAIDGPVPMAKLVCQRSRRYKKVLEDRYKEKLRDRFGEHGDKPRSFDTTKLTPGTAFMDKLVSRMRTFLPLAVPNTCSIILSDHHVPGEGEHKLMHFLHTIPWGERVCIYGLDADLIVLTLLSRRTHLYLARDPDPEKISAQTPGYERLTILSVDDCRTQVLTRMIGWSRDHGRVVRDFCLLSLFGGNDFIRALPTTSIRSGGLDRLIDAYLKSVAEPDDSYLIEENGNAIDWRVVQRFVQCIAETEDEQMKANQYKQFRGRFRTYPIPQNVQEAFVQYEHMPFVHPQHPFYHHAQAASHAIDVRKPFDVWSNRYGRVFDLPTNRGDVVKAYQASIRWCWLYYTQNTPPTWDFFYPYRAAPLANWIRDVGWEFKTPSWIGSRVKPYEPLVQLAFVVPWKCSYLLPRCMQTLKSPVSIRIDYALAEKSIYAEPILPSENIETYENIVRERFAAFDPLEKKRNRLFVRHQVLSKPS